MTLENQVCSLELAQKLKDFGVKQESVFAWYDGKVVAHSESHPNRLWGGAALSAFTVAELGEMLSPTLVEGKRFWFSDTKEARTNSTYMIDEANSRAKMLIYLIENNLITIWNAITENNITS